MYNYRFSDRYAGRRAYAPARPAWSVSQDRAGLDFESVRWTSFRDANPAVAGWIEAKADRADFAASLASYVMRKGDLTPGQKAAVEKCLARDAERALPQSPEFNNGVDQTAIREVLASRTRVTIAGFTFSMASATSRNPGAIYVKFNGEYVGKVLAGVGEFYPAPAFDRAKMDALRAIFANPGDAVRADAAERARLLAEAAARRAAQIAAGEEPEAPVSIPCGCCGIMLTDPESVARGIGPICAGKWGF